MSTDSKPKPAIIPTLRYHDARAAIAFLCEAFGFEERVVASDENDSTMVHHAQLMKGGNMIMLASMVDTEFSKAAMTTVKEAGGNTQSVYIVIDEDVDQHAERARTAGAEIFIEPADQDYGGRVYSAFDPEGVAWSFGSFDPFAD